MAEEKQETALAPVDEEHGLTVSIPPQLDPTRQLAAIWCSRKPDSDNDRATLLAALQGSQAKLSAMLNKSILISDVAFQTVTLTDKDTGETFPAVRTIVFTPTGESYGAVSDGVRATLGMAFQLWGQPPWVPPLPFMMKSLERPGGKRYFYLEYDKTTPRKPKSSR